jgi:Autographiviridae endonuclease VII
MTEAQRQKQREGVKRYRARHPERVKIFRRKTFLKWKYGISLETYEALLQAQGEVCAICGNKAIFGIQKWLAVDHSHSTGKIRGLLCTKCNSLLGLADDSVARLETAIAYLKKHKE